MREDMAKVICEKPRGKSGVGKSVPPKGTKKRLRHEMLNDETHPFESNAPRRIYGWNAKEFGELLGPLRGFLYSRVGHRWNDVYSEVCERINPNSVVQKHILTHLLNYVAQDVLIEDGKIYYAKPQPYVTHKYGHAAVRMEIDEIVYVHPVSGILLRNPHTEKRHRRHHYGPHPKKFVSISQLHCYKQGKDGVWWELWLAEMKPNNEYGAYSSLNRWYDMFIKNYVSCTNNSHYISSAYEHYGVTNVYCYKKRQLGKAEIRRLKKNNPQLI